MASRWARTARLALWIDIGRDDPWANHSAAYWKAHVVDYVRFYDGALHTVTVGRLQ